MISKVFSSLFRVSAAFCCRFHATFWSTVSACYIFVKAYEKKTKLQWNCWDFICVHSEGGGKNRLWWNLRVIPSIFTSRAWKEEYSSVSCKQWMKIFGIITQLIPRHCILNKHRLHLLMRWDFHLTVVSLIASSFQSLLGNMPCKFCIVINLYGERSIEFHSFFSLVNVFIPRRTIYFGI